MDNSNQQLSVCTCRTIITKLKGSKEKWMRNAGEVLNSQTVFDLEFFFNVLFGQVIGPCKSSKKTLSEEDREILRSFSELDPMIKKLYDEWKSLAPTDAAVVGIS